MTNERLALRAAIRYVERNTPHLVRDEIRTLVSERDELASRVRELEGELSFLNGDLLYWVDRAVRKGNANSDTEEAHERYEQWLQQRAALNASKEQP